MKVKLVNLTVIVTIITFLSKMVGFLRDIIFASSFGASVASDAYIMAQTITDVIIAIVIAALNTTFIPIYSDYVNRHTEHERRRFLNVCYTFFGICSAIIVGLSIIFSEQIVLVFAPNFNNITASLTKDILTIISITMFISVIVSLNNARLQSHQNFVLASCIGFPMNLTLILYMLMASKNASIIGLSVALTLGIAFQLVLQWTSMRKMKPKFGFDFDFNEPGLKKIGILILPIMFGSAIQQINVMVDKILGSGLPEGSIAALNFSNRLVLFVVGILSAVIGSIFYTSMSSYFSMGKDSEFKNLLVKSTNVLILLVTPASLGFLVLRLPIVRLVFERGQFDAYASSITAQALFFYAIGLIGYSLRDVYSRALYAIKDTTTAMVNGVIATVTNIVLSVALVSSMGVGGLALGTSVSALLSTTLLMIALHRKIGDFGLSKIVKLFVKVLLMSVIMAIIVHYGYTIIYDLIHSNTIGLLLSILIGVTVYVIMILKSKIEEVEFLKELILSRRTSK